MMGKRGPFSEFRAGGNGHDWNVSFLDQSNGGRVGTQFLFDEQAAKTIAESMNNCRSVSPDHPELAAEAIPEAFKLLERVTKSSTRMDGHDIIYQVHEALVRDISSLLSRLTGERG
jgi:hypothetical protein